MSFNILQKYLVTVSPSSFSVLICIRGPWPIITSLLPNLLTLERPAHAFSGFCMRYRIKGRGIKRQPMIKMHEMQLPFKYLSLSLHSASFLLSSTLSFINPVIKIISYLHSAACTPHYFVFLSWLFWQSRYLICVLSSIHSATILYKSSKSRRHMFSLKDFSPEETLWITVIMIRFCQSWERCSTSYFKYWAQCTGRKLFTRYF